MAKQDRSRGRGNRKRPSSQNSERRPKRREEDKRPQRREEEESANSRAARASREEPKKGKGLIIGLVSFIVIVLLATGYVFTEISGTFRGSNEVHVKVAEGATSKDVAAELKEAKAIGSEALFQLYCRVTKSSADFKQGAFKFQGGGSYKEICDALAGDPNDIQAVTIIEGENIVQIAEKVAATGICTKEEFIAEANKDHDFYFEKQLETSKKVLFKYEGFLYPDTYYYDENDTAKTMVVKMKQNFDDKLTDEHYDKMKEMGLTLRETIGLASIIQKEAGEVGEMKRVSSVFHNRLDSYDLRMLQSSVTTVYVRNVIKTYKPKNTTMQTEYNTYETEGIPPGPICSPGIDAIVATLNPASTSYLYFLTDDEWNYYYAKTFAEHTKNLQKAEEVNKKVAREKGNS